MKEKMSLNPAEDPGVEKLQAIQEEMVREDFDKQFGRRTKLDFLDSKLEVVDAAPEDPKSEVPVLVAPGYTETINSFEDSLFELFRRKRRVLSLTHPRHGAGPESVNGLPKAEERKAEALEKILKELEKEGVGKVDVVAHSEGAINTVMAALLQPEKFRNIILVNPAGMAGKDNFFSIAFRAFMKDQNLKRKLMPTFEPEAQARTKRAGKEAVLYMLSNPLRAIAEGQAIADIQIHEMLKELHERGVGVSVIHSVDDILFPMDKVQVVAKKDQLDGFYSVRGGHDHLVSHPEQYMGLAEEALSALERKQEKAAGVS